MAGQIHAAVISLGVIPLAVGGTDISEYLAVHPDQKPRFFRLNVRRLIPHIGDHFGMNPLQIFFRQEFERRVCIHRTLRALIVPNVEHVLTVKVQRPTRKTVVVPLILMRVGPVGRF